MSLASTRLSLTHLCTIERNTNAGADGWGDPGVPTFATLAANVPCRVGVNAGQEVVDATTTAVIQDMRLILPPGTDVTELDLIGDITYRGATIVSGPVGIRSVLWRQDHIELVLKQVS